MRYVITLGDLSEMDAEGDEIETPGGALVFKTEGFVTRVFARGVWRSARRHGLDPLPAPPPKPPAQEPRLPLQPIPDPGGKS